MFSLNDSMRYMWYTQPTDMRKSYNTLSGIVTNAMGCDPCDGSVYVFMNKARNRIKLLHWEPGGMVIYSKLLESGTFGHPNLESKDEIAGTIEWRCKLPLFVSWGGYSGIWCLLSKESLRNRTVGNNGSKT